MRCGTYAPVHRLPSLGHPTRARFAFPLRHTPFVIPSSDFAAPPLDPTDPASASQSAAMRELMAVREIARVFLTADRAEEIFSFGLERVAPLASASAAGRAARR
jgi:hypothetical protein